MHSLNHFRIVSLTCVIQPRTEHLVRLFACHLAFMNELSTSIDILSAIFHILGINLHNDFSSFGYKSLNLGSKTSGILIDSEIIESEVG